MHPAPDSTGQKTAPRIVQHRVLRSVMLKEGQNKHALLTPRRLQMYRTSYRSVQNNAG